MRKNGIFWLPAFHSPVTHLLKAHTLKSECHKAANVERTNYDELFFGPELYGSRWKAYFWENYEVGEGTWLYLVFFNLDISNSCLSFTERRK